MHEGHFTQQIVERILLDIDSQENKTIKSVTVRVGEVFHLVPEAVQMHYQMMIKGTPLDGVELNLVEEPMQVLCENCQKQGPVEDHHMLICSYCHSSKVKPVCGDKIFIEKVESLTP